jgi:hypothetical protein
MKNKGTKRPEKVRRDGLYYTCSSVSWEWARHCLHRVALEGHSCHLSSDQSPDLFLVCASSVGILPIAQAAPHTTSGYDDASRCYIEALSLQVLPAVVFLCVTIPLLAEQLAGPPCVLSAPFAMHRTPTQDVNSNIGGIREHVRHLLDIGSVSSLSPSPPPQPILEH